MFWKINISYPLIRTRTYMWVSEVRNVSFWEKNCVYTKWMIPYWITDFVSWVELKAIWQKTFHTIDLFLYMGKVYKNGPDKICGR